MEKNETGLTWIMVHQSCYTAPKFRNTHDQQNNKRRSAEIGPDVSVSIIHVVERSPRSIHFVLGCPPVHLMILHVWPTFFITFSCLLPTTHLRKIVAAMLEYRT